MMDYLIPYPNYLEPAVASTFDELSFWSSRFGRLLYDHIEFAPNLRVLDLGCGTGFPLFELAHSLGRSCQFVGLDPWRGGLKRAAFKLKTYQLRNVNLVYGDGRKIPFPADHFDLITSNLGINNFESPAAVLAECARVIKAGGKLVMTSNIKGHMQEFYAVYREILTAYGNPLFLEKLDQNEDHRGTKESIQALLEKAGFRVSKMVEDSFQMRYLNGSALLRHSLSRFGFMDGWRAVITPEVEVEIFTALENRLNEIAHQQGELKMTVPMVFVEAKRT